MIMVMNGNNDMHHLCLKINKEQMVSIMAIKETLILPR
jgi:hypothetical protein